MTLTDAALRVRDLHDRFCVQMERLNHAAQEARRNGCSHSASLDAGGHRALQPVVEALRELEGELAMAALAQAGGGQQRRVAR